MRIVTNYSMEENVVFGLPCSSRQGLSSDSVDVVDR